MDEALLRTWLQTQYKEHKAIDYGSDDWDIGYHRGLADAFEEVLKKMDDGFFR